MAVQGRSTSPSFRAEHEKTHSSESTEIFSTQVFRDEHSVAINLVKHSDIHGIALHGARDYVIQRKGSGPDNSVGAYITSYSSVRKKGCRQEVHL